jgi:hypothetical protein
MKPSNLVMVTVLAWAWAQATPARAQSAPAETRTPAPVETPPPVAEPPSSAPAGEAAPPVAPPTAPAAATPAPAAPAPAPVTPPAPTEKPDAAETRAKPAKPAQSAQSSQPLLGLAVATPDTGAMPGKFKPSFGVAPRTPSDWRFDFHGYLNVPLRFGVGSRENAAKTQYETVFHGPPLAADEYERFEHTGLVPQPWVQLGFSYGNSASVATVIVAARSASNATSYFDPPTELGINDAFVTFKPSFGALQLNIDVGAFANRYGSLGEYDTGRYDTSVIARVAGVGETLRASIPLSDSLVFMAEHGISGQFERAPLGVAPAGWNGFADSNVGTSFAHHAHLGLGIPGSGQLGLHYVNAFNHDDRTAPNQPDGGLTVFGADLRGALGAFGRFTLAGGHTIADHAVGVSGVVRVLNAFGGPGLMREYFGPKSRGTGSLTTAGLQYDFSFGEIVRSPSPFSGYAPDVFVSAFGMLASAKSDDKTTYTRDQATGQILLDRPGGKSRYDGVTRLKYGAEVTYSALSWLAGALRYDRVVANTDDDAQTFAALTPRLIFRSDYNSQDQVTLSYSRFFYGNGVVLRPGYRKLDEPSVVPDDDVFSLSATMWW